MRLAIISKIEENIMKGSTQLFSYRNVKVDGKNEGRTKENKTFLIKNDFILHGM